MGLVMLLVSFLRPCSADPWQPEAGGHRVHYRIAKNVREGMYNHIQEFSFSNIDHFSTAGLVTRLTTDVTNVQNAFQMMMRMLMRAPVMLITAMTMTFIINAKLSCVYLVALVFLGIVIAFLMGRVGKYFRDMFDRYDDLNADIQENLTGIRVVKARPREEHEKRSSAKASEAVYLRGSGPEADGQP